MEKVAERETSSRCEELGGKGSFQTEFQEEGKPEKTLFLSSGNSQEGSIGLPWWASG